MILYAFEQKDQELWYKLARCVMHLKIEHRLFFFESEQRIFLA